MLTHNVLWTEFRFMQSQCAHCVRLPFCNTVPKAADRSIDPRTYIRVLSRRLQQVDDTLVGHLLPQQSPLPDDAVHDGVAKLAAWW